MRRFTDESRKHQSLTLRGAYIDSNTVRAFRFAKIGNHCGNSDGTAGMHYPQSWRKLKPCHTAERSGISAMYPEEEIGSIRLNILRYSSVFGADMLPEASVDGMVSASYAQENAIGSEKKAMSTVTHIAK